MSFLNQLERRFGWIAIPNITLYIIIGQVIVFTLQTFANYPMEAIALIPAKVAEGEVWRLLTFIVYPPMVWHPIFLIFAWFILWMMGSSLEQIWGSFRYTLYLLTGLLLTIVAAGFTFIVSPYTPLTNLFITTSIFLAFAYVNPNYEFMLFFILPVKVKWLAIITWALLLFSFILGTILGKVMILAGIGNFILFFGKEIVTGFKHRRQVKARRAKYEADTVSEDEPFHKCVVCGITDRDDPNMEFVYHNGKGYCEEHAHLAK